MPNVHFICYADQNYRGQQAEIMVQAGDFDTRTAYSERDVQDLYVTHRAAFDRLKHAGCIWKPYIILDALTKAADGDIVFYSDCGDSISRKNNYAELIRNNMRQDVFLITCGYPNSHYTKEYCFVEMGCSDPKYRDGKHLEAGQVGFVKTDFNISFVNEWLYWCKRLDVLLDDEFGISNGICKRHSRDQSILTNLQIRYNLPVHNVSLIYGKYVFFNVR